MVTMSWRHPNILSSLSLTSRDLNCSNDNKGGLLAAAPTEPVESVDTRWRFDGGLGFT